MTSNTVTAECPSCGFTASVPSSYAGRTVRCRCGTRFQVTAPRPVGTVLEVAVRKPGPAPTAFEDPVPPADPSPAPTAYEGSQPEVAQTHAALQRNTVQGSSPTLSARSAEWAVGETFLDLYEVTGILGQGGMGRVYRVRHRGWDVDLAVKAPLPAVLKALGGADNFEREAETWVNLGLHPHTVSCYYVRRVHGTPLVFAEFVDGGSLDDWIRKRRLTQLDRILDVAIQFAWGLHYAHEQGLVHRDVKPANVMVSADGVAKVTDFGLARARPMAPVASSLAGPGQTLMVAGGAGGTPAYMSPEQSAGAALTRRTDLWSWALAVLEMFQGLRTWEYGVAGPEVLREFLNQGGKAVGRPALPKGVASLLEQCFAQDPDARPRTLWDAATVLYGAYEEATATTYPRPEPQAGRDTADSLNNRAVSLLDLGRDAEAEPLWQRALQAQPHHLESTYNLALHAWSRAQGGDAKLLNQMEEARKSHPTLQRGRQLQGRLLMALGEYGQAARALEEAAAVGRTIELDRELGRALLAQGRDGADAVLWQRASECFARILQDGQADPADVVGQALCLTRLDQSEVALRFYADARQRRPELPESLEAGITALLPGYEVLRTIKGFAQPLTSLTLTPDGRLLAAGEGGSVRVFQTRDGSALRTFYERDVRVRACALTPPGKQLLWTAEGAPLQLWDIESGRNLRSFQRHPGALTCLTIDPLGRGVLAGGSDRLVRHWDLASGQLLHALEGHQEAVAAVAVSGDGERGLSGGVDGSVRTWDLSSGRALATLSGHKGRVGAVAFAGNLGLVLSAGDDHTLRLWDAERKRSRILEGHQQSVTSLAVSPDGRVAFSGSLDRTVRVWDLLHASLIAVLRLEAGVVGVGLGELGQLWAASGNTLVALRIPERANLPAPAVCRPVSALEVERRDVSFQGRLDEAEQALRQGKIETALGLAQRARSIPGYERSEAALALWDEITTLLPRKGLQSAWEMGALPGHGDPILALAVSADGSRVVTGGMDSTVRLWDVEHHQELALLRGHTDTVAAVGFTPDGRLLISGGWDKTLRVWDVASGQTVHVLEGHGEYVSGLAVAPEGGQLVSASWDQTLRLWDLTRGRFQGEFQGHTSNVSAVAFGPDGRFIVSGSWDQTVRAWDLASRQCVAVLEGHDDNISAVAVNASGRTLASGGLDLRIRLWDLRSRRALRTLTGHEAEVTALAFTPDSRYLVSASRDKTVRIWEVATGKMERMLTHTAAVLALGLTPSATDALTGGADLVLHRWHLDWEPDPRPLPSWDEKARPYLETFVSLRLKPQTTRLGSATFSDGDVDTLLRDLRKRGFGGLRREAVAGKLQDLTTRTDDESSFWDEVRKSAPRAARAKARSGAWRSLPWKRVAMVAAVVVSFVIAGLAWYRPAPRPRLVEHVVKGYREVDLIELTAFGGGCDTGEYAVYLELALAKDVSADTLACLARKATPATVDDYLDAARLQGTDAVEQLTLSRNAISLLTALGENAVHPLCMRLGDPRGEVRSVVAQALTSMHSPTATKCLTDALTHSNPIVRSTAASTLQILLANHGLGIEDGLARIGTLLHDAEPAVRSEALRNLQIYNADVVRPLAVAALRDPDAAVQEAARVAIATIDGAARYEKLGGK